MIFDSLAGNSGTPNLKELMDLFIVSLDKSGLEWRETQKGISIGSDLRVLLIEVLIEKFHVRFQLFEGRSIDGVHQGKRLNINENNVYTFP